MSMHDVALARVTYLSNRTHMRASSFFPANGLSLTRWCDPWGCRCLPSLDVLSLHVNYMCKESLLVGLCLRGAIDSRQAFPNILVGVVVFRSLVFLVALNPGHPTLAFHPDLL